MENLIWLVVIGSVFFFMMRKGGCCGGHSHGKAKGKSASTQSGGAKGKDEKKSSCH